MIALIGPFIRGFFYKKKTDLMGFFFSYKYKLNAMSEIWT